MVKVPLQLHNLHQIIVIPLDQNTGCIQKWKCCNNSFKMQSLISSACELVRTEKKELLPVSFLRMSCVSLLGWIPLLVSFCRREFEFLPFSFGWLDTFCEEGYASLHFSPLNRFWNACAWMGYCRGASLVWPRICALSSPVPPSLSFSYWRKLHNIINWSDID